MDYELVRNEIKDGQIVFINAVTLGQKIISVFTGGKFSHVGFVVWMTDSTGNKKLMCLESSVGGARLVQLRAYLERGMTIVDIGLKWEDCAGSAFGDTGVLHYNVTNLVLIGIKTLLQKVGLDFLAKYVRSAGSGEVCSEFVATLLEENGYVLDSFTSPNALYESLVGLPNLSKSIPIAAQIQALSHK